MKILSILFLLLLQSHVSWALPAALEGNNLLSGAPLSISTNSSQGKGLVVVFLSAKCPCSNSHIPLLKKLAAEFKDFRFLAVHSNGDEADSLSKAYFTKAELPFPVMEDKKSAVADELRAFKTPHCFVISPSGQILYQGGMTNSHNGAEADKQYLADALHDIESGKAVREANGRTMGCVIARGSK